MEEITQKQYEEALEKYIKSRDEFNEIQMLYAPREVIDESIMKSKIQESIKKSFGVIDEKLRQIKYDFEVGISQVKGFLPIRFEIDLKLNNSTDSEELIEISIVYK